VTYSQFPTLEQQQQVFQKSLKSKSKSKSKSIDSASQVNLTAPRLRHDAVRLSGLAELQKFGFDTFLAISLV
jgi:hypothetical protein